MYMPHPASGNAAVHRHRRTSHKRRVRRTEQEADPRNLLRVSNTPEGMLVADPLNLRRIIDVNHLTEHRREYSTRTDAVDTNIFFPMIERQRFRQVNHTGLGGTVRKMLGHAEQASDRGDVD